MSDKKAIRFNQGKPKISLVLDMPIAVRGVSRVMEYGIGKGYPRCDWKNGFEVDELLDSLMRHVLEYKEGNTIDKSSGIDHLFHIASNAMMLAELHGKDGEDETKR